MLNRGYSYNLLSEALLKESSAVVTKGVLAADGPAYRALIVKDATRLSVFAAQKLIDCAKAGLPIILYNSAITRVYGTNRASNNDTLLEQKLAELSALPNVSSVATQADLLSRLADRRVTPAASYSVAGLEASHRQAPEGDYYYLHNAGTTLAGAVAAGGTGMRVASTSGLSAGDTLAIDEGANRETLTIASIPSPEPAAPNPNVLLTAPLARAHAAGGGGGSGGGRGGARGGARGGGLPPGPPGPSGSGGTGAVINALVGKSLTLAGSGTPYLLDAFTGEITPVAEYTTGGGTVSLKLSSELCESKIVALASDTTAFPKANRLHATGVSGGEVVCTDSGNHLAQRATRASTYSVSLSDGRRATVTVESLPAAISLSDHWKIDLESWGPDPALTTVDPRENPAVDPTRSAKIRVSLSDVSLVSWTNLRATAEQLAAFGVSRMDQVSGIGTYSTTFELTDAWFTKQAHFDVGAHLRLTHGSDMVTAVTINGRLIDNLNLRTPDPLSSKIVITTSG